MRLSVRHGSPADDPVRTGTRLPDRDCRGYAIAPVIDGYSVQEAASVLGVPEGRVWELLARGVLSGTPEGDSMRVYLKADAGPVATSPRDEPPKTNGNTGSHANGGEASAFRELLTEFRNLTERYGQALLALGEARGEVAGLRSRVDLLEARLDLRLPTTPDAGSMAWESPPVAPVALGTPPAAPAAPAPPAAEPRAAEPPAAEPRPAVREPGRPPSAPVRRAARSRKARSTRSAVDSFAQALARAQDPTTAEVGDMPAAVDPPAAADMAPQPDDVLASLLDEAVQEPMPEQAAIAGPEPPIEEPAPSDVAVAEQVATETEMVATAPEAGVADLESAAAESEPEPAAVALQAAFDEPEAAGGEPAANVVEPEVAATTEPEAAPPTYSAAVVEPDWFADGDFAWLDAAGLEAGSPPVDRAIEPPGAEREASSPAVENMVAPAPAEPEPADEAAPESISAGETEAAPSAEFETDRPSMPDLPPMPDLPEALDLPATPEAQLQPSPEFQPEPEVAQSVVELREPLQPFEAAQTLEPPEVEAAQTLEPPEVESARAEPAEPDEPIQARGPDPGPPDEEVMWLGAEGEAGVEMEMASTGWRAEPRSAPTITAAPLVARPEPPLLRMTEEELARLARDEGWDEAEVAAIRAMIVPPPPRRVQLPGAAELDEAMAALHAVPVDANEEAYSSREWAKPPAETRPARYDDWAFEVEPPRPRPIIDPLPPRRQPADPGWLRRRQGPAATAYRRLRRLFPG
jgi:hypothetical protein